MVFSTIGKFLGSAVLGPLGGQLGSSVGSFVDDKVLGIGPGAQQRANYEAQKEFATHGIRWKVADAKAAGIHPLFALGGNTASYSPNPIVAGDYGVGASGQNIGRAIEAKQTPGERIANNWNEEISRERALLENELVRTQIASAQLALKKQAAQPPPLPAVTTVKQGVKPVSPKQGTQAFGLTVEPFPGNANAEDLEARYGELGGSIVGLANLPADVLYTLYTRGKHSWDAAAPMRVIPQRSRSHYVRREANERKRRAGMFRR